MILFLLKKLLESIPTLIGVTLVSFILIRAVPGDPVLLLLGERGGNPEVYKEMQKSLGLNRSLPVQYLSFVGNALQGKLGRSIVSKRPVTEEFMARFPATFELGITALTWAILLGLPLGILAGLKRGGPLDYTLMSVSLVGYSMPIFWWGLILIIVFSVGLGLTPVSGRISFMYDVPHLTGFLLIDSWFSDEPLNAFRSALSHLILPAIAMGTIPMAVVARMSRSSFLEVLGQDYIRTARAKGLPRMRVLFVHALRNALSPIITVVGLMFGSIITGAILTETIFSWPGIGKWLVASINARDYPVIQGGILIISCMIVAINVSVDLLYAWANPKLRSGGQ